MDVLYVNNDHVVEIQGLRDADGKALSAADVEATLYESDGETEVTGVAWPLPLLYQGPPGVYQGELTNAVAVVPGRRYVLKLSAVYVGKRFEATRHVRAEVRYS